MYTKTRSSATESAAATYKAQGPQGHNSTNDFPGPKALVCGTTKILLWTTLDEKSPRKEILLLSLLKGYKMLDHKLIWPHLKVHGRHCARRGIIVTSICIRTRENSQEPYWEATIHPVTRDVGLLCDTDKPRDLSRRVRKATAIQKLESRVRQQQEG